MTCWSRRWRRVQDAEILHLLKLMLKASGRREVPQGGVIAYGRVAYAPALDPTLPAVIETSVRTDVEYLKPVRRRGRHVNGPITGRAAIGLRRNRDTIPLTRFRPRARLAHDRHREERRVSVVLKVLSQVWCAEAVVKR